MYDPPLTPGLARENIEGTIDDLVEEMARFSDPRAAALAILCYLSHNEYLDNTEADRQLYNQELIRRQDERRAKGLLV